MFIVLLSGLIVVAGCGSSLGGRDDSNTKQENAQKKKCEGGQQFKLLQFYPGRFLALHEVAYLESHYVDNDSTMQKYANSAALYRDQQIGDFIRSDFQLEFSDRWKKLFLKSFNKLKDRQFRTAEESDYLIGRSAAYLNFAIAAQFNAQISDQKISIDSIFGNIFGDDKENFVRYVKFIMEDEFRLKSKIGDSGLSHSTRIIDDLELVLRRAVDSERYLWAQFIIQYLINNNSHKNGIFEEIEILNNNLSELSYIRISIGSKSDGELGQDALYGNYDTMRKVAATRSFSKIRKTGICEYDAVPLVALELAVKQLKNDGPNSEYRKSMKEIISLHREER